MKAKVDNHIPIGFIVIWKGEALEVPKGWVHVCMEVDSPRDCKTNFHYIQRIDNLTYLQRKYETKKK